MFIIKWLNAKKKEIYYSYTSDLIGARTDVHPYIGFYYIGYKNGYDHEIIDIVYLMNGKFYTLEEYKQGLMYEKNKGIKNVIKRLLGGNGK